MSKVLCVLLASMPSVVFATGEAVEAAKPSFFESMVPFVFIFVLMYFLLIRPQVKKAKEHTSLLGSLQVGEEVVTSGGIIGRLKSISETFVVLDIGSTTVKILKENILRTTHPKNANVKPSVKEVNQEKSDKETAS